MDMLALHADAACGRIARRVRRLADRLRAAALGLLAVAAQSDGGEADAPGLRIELKRVEPRENGACRVWFVLNNRGAEALDPVRLAPVLFSRDGVVARRLAVDVGPLPARRTQARIARTVPPVVVTMARDEAELAARIRSLCEAEANDAPVHLRADRAVAHGEVMRVVGRVVAAGVARVSLIAEGEAAGPAIQAR
jgi:hypothetical protein